MSSLRQVPLSVPPPLRHPLVWIERRDDLRAIERDWKQFSRVLPPNPFLSWEWQHAWLESQPRLRPLIAAAVFGDGSLAALLPLQRRWRRGLRQIEFLGHGSGADDLECLRHPQAPLSIVGDLLRAALQRCGWQLLRMENIAAGGELDRALEHELGPPCAEAGEVLPWLALPGRFETFLNSRSSNFRAEIRRRRRRFAARCPEAFLERASSPSEVATALDQLFRLHNLRRAQKGGRGIFESSPLRRFYRQAAVQLASGGHSCVYLLRTPGEALAALYGFEAGDTFLYVQSGFHPDWSELSPGTVLLSAVVQNCIERGLRRFEFLRGEETYKSRWCVEQRRARNWIAARGPVGRAYLRLRRWKMQGGWNGRPATMPKGENSNESTE